jgi:L-threonylcarbamoyladenylate synthase
MTIVAVTSEAIDAAAEALRAGRLVAFPTETVYGLGADATDDRAVAAIFAAKGRPRFNPLIVHVADLAAAGRVGVLDARAQALAARFWPGPLTLVVRRRPQARISDLVTAGLETVAVRVPGDATASALLRRSGLPVAAPSANRSGHVSPTAAAHVASDLGDLPVMILDAGPCRHGLESTVIDLSAEVATLLRPGAVTAASIEDVLGGQLARLETADARPASPGQLASHYAPRARVRLNAYEAGPDEALLAFGSNVPATRGPVLNLSEGGDLTQAACRLFSALRALDATGVAGIAVMPVPEIGLGEAINDRLRRAAAVR